MADDRKDRFVKARVDGVDLIAPYAFVDMAPFAVPTPWDGAPRHDKPHPDGISGEITVRWTAESPILVGGEGKLADSFFRMNPDDEKSIALPGSTLRGAVRALLEAMTSARMEHIDRNAVYSVRDFSGDDGRTNRWKRTMNAWVDERNAPKPPNAGFLREDKTGWYLQPTRWMEVRVGELLEFFGLSTARSEFEAANVARKYELLGERSLQAVWVESLDRKLTHEVLRKAGRTYKPGRLIFSGIDPKSASHADDERKKAKQKEAIFFTDEASMGAEIKLTAETIDRFLFVHGGIPTNPPDETNKWSTLTYCANAMKTKQLPIPVFWIDAHRLTADTSELASGIILSLARSMKIPFRQSVGQVLMAQREAAQCDPSLDLVQALFGHVPHEGADGPPVAGDPRKSAWRGRVQFADAPVTDASVWEVQPSQSGIMGQPRPSFWPYYLRPEQDGDNVAPADWSTAGVNLAGFKRYPVRSSQSNFIQPQNGNEGVSSRMNFIKAKANQKLEFEGRIRVHNLLPEELGALVFALCFGPPKTDPVYRHAIGRAKPQGYGRVKARITSIDRLFTNMGDKLTGDIVATAVNAFQKHVTDAYNERAGTSFSFADTPCVADTLAMQNPVIGEAVKHRLVYPTGKGNNDASPEVAGYTRIKAAAARHEPKAKLPRYPHKS